MWHVQVCARFNLLPTHTHPLLTILYYSNLNKITENKRGMWEDKGKKRSEKRGGNKKRKGGNRKSRCG